MTRVYLSSPYQDLVKYRQATYRALRQSGVDVIAMEDYVARDSRVLSACLEDIRISDIYIGLMAFRYGSIVPDDDVRTEFGDDAADDWLGLSLTEAEYQYAKDVVGIPCLSFVAKEKFPWNPQFIDAYVFASEPNPGGKAADFRKRLSRERLSGEFSTPFELASMVQAAITRTSHGRTLARLAETGQRIWSVPSEGSPFPGLRPFSRRMARVYFGREAEVRDVSGLVSASGSRFVIVSGGSGSGKSSMIEAGVIPNVVANGIDNCPNVRSVRIRPSACFDALDALIGALCPELVSTTYVEKDLRGDLANRPTLLGDLLKASVHPQRPGAGLLIHVDQFEEVFARHNQPVVDTLVSVLADLHVVESIRVLACVRADYLVNCLEFDRLLEIFHQGGHYPLGPVNLMTMAEIIRSPCRAASLSITDRLISRIIGDLGTGPGVLPLLAFVLEQLFLQRSGMELREETYDALGGAAGAIARIAEEATANLVVNDATMTGDLHALFSRLVRLDLDGTPLKRDAVRTLLSRGERALVDRLVSARLLAVEGSGSRASVSLAHEALFGAWPDLRIWIDEHKEHLLLTRLAEVQASEWSRHHFDPAYLWHMERLKQLRVALAALPDVFSPAIREFAQPQERLVARLSGDLSHEERLSIGLYLGELGDPREGVGVTSDGRPDVLWRNVSTGSTLHDDASRADYATRTPFQIAKYPITGVQYRTFIEADDGYANEDWWRGLAVREVRPGAQFRRVDNHPAENVSWHDAVAYCRWLSSRLGHLVRLPTDLEWTAAWTSGDPQRTWPWGYDWDPSRSNQNEANLGRTTAVGMYPQGDSCDGVSDLAGNVWEWCLSTVIGGSSHANDLPTDPMDRDTECVIRGGSWYLSRFGPRTVVRTYRTEGRDFAIGFRICAPAQ